MDIINLKPIEFKDIPPFIQRMIRNLRNGQDPSGNIMENREQVKATLLEIGKVIDKCVKNNADISNIYEDFILPALNDCLKIILGIGEENKFQYDVQNYINSETENLTLSKINKTQAQLIKQAFQVFGVEFGEVVANGIIENSQVLSDHLEG